MNKEQVWVNIDSEHKEVVIVLSNYKPVAQKRHRDAKNGGKYDPSKPDKINIGWLLKKAAPKNPFSGPVCIRATYCFKRPPSHYTKRGKLKNCAQERMINKPDIDNLNKLLYDSMTGLFWVDDSQITTGLGVKRWDDVNALQITIIYMDITEDEFRKHYTKDNLIYKKNDDNMLFDFNKESE